MTMTTDAERLAPREPEFNETKAGTEAALDAALARELKLGSAFLHWLVSRTRFADEEVDEIVLLRTNNPWGKAKLRVWNGDEQRYESIVREGETDLLLVLKSRRRGRFALHIENKLANGSFTPLQPEVYRARAAAWMGNKSYGDYEEWETILIAPTAFHARNSYGCSKFDRYIPHEDIAAHIPEFASNLPSPN